LLVALGEVLVLVLAVAEALAVWFMLLLYL
jgi:hypothetical protein